MPCGGCGPKVYKRESSPAITGGYRERLAGKKPNYPTISKSKKSPGERCSKCGAELKPHAKRKLGGWTVVAFCPICKCEM